MKRLKLFKMPQKPQAARVSVAVIVVAPSANDENPSGPSFGEGGKFRLSSVSSCYAMRHAPYAIRFLITPLRSHGI